MMDLLALLFGRRALRSATAGLAAAAGITHLASGAPAERYGVSSEFSLPPQVWVGEVFSVTHRLTIPQKYFYALASGINWSPSALAIEPWSAPLRASTGSGESGQFEFATHSRAMAMVPGTAELAAGRAGGDP